jgi:hypothetical protein
MEIIDKENFATEFMNRYSTRGFGAMNKNDFEVMIFDLLRKYGDLQDKSHYEISIDLQIPETKVRRLAYESDLKYRQLTEQDIATAFFKILAKSKFRGDLNKVEFVIENKFIRTSISAQLKKLGHYADSSFNSEIIRIHIDSFIDLLEHYYPDTAIKKIVKDCKKAIKTDKDTSEITFKLVFRKFLEGLSTQVGKKTIDLGVGYFTGGVENVQPLINGIKNIINGG